MQRHEYMAQAGIFTYRQIFYPAVLEELRRHALERAHVVGEDRLGPAAMPDDMRQSRAVTIYASYAMRIAVHIGQTYTELVVIGNRLAQFVEAAGIRYQQIFVSPQTAQIHIQLALVI